MFYIYNFIRLIRLIFIFLYTGVIFNLFLLYSYKIISSRSNGNSFKKLKIINNRKQKLAKKIVIALPFCGPAFVKFGQFLATRNDLINPIMCNELKQLHDKLPADNFKKIKKIIENEFCNNAINNNVNYINIDNINQIFLSINEIPIAAASVAQVHEVITKDKKKIALKILRPNIHKKFAANLEVLKLLVKIINILLSITKLSNVKRLRLYDIIETIRKSSEIELNMYYEAAAAAALKQNLKDDPNVYIPEIYWEYTTSKILALEWIDGIPLSNTPLLIKMKHDLTKIAKHIAISFFNQAYRDGFFHADIHPGNILINKKSQVVFIDFGMISFLPEFDRLIIAEILYAFTKCDYEKAAELHFKAKYVPKTESVQLFALACRSISEPILKKSSNEISIANLLQRLFIISENFKMETQPQLLMLQKNMVTVEGLVSNIAPDINMWKILEPWFQNWAKDNLGHKAQIKRSTRDASKLMEYASYKLRECVGK